MPKQWYFRCPGMIKHQQSATSLGSSQAGKQMQPMREYGQHWIAMAPQLSWNLPVQSQNWGNYLRLVDSYSLITIQFNQQNLRSPTSEMLTRTHNLRIGMDTSKPVFHHSTLSSCSIIQKPVTRGVNMGTRTLSKLSKTGKHIYIYIYKGGPSDFPFQCMRIICMYIYIYI